MFVNKLKRMVSTKNTKKAGSTLYICILCGLMTTDKDKTEGHACILG